jgi:hypothetical protein
MKSINDLELDYRYVVSTRMCRSCGKKLHKVTDGIFLYKLSCDIDKSAQMIFVA